MELQIDTAVLIVMAPLVTGLCQVAKAIPAIGRRPKLGPLVAVAMGLAVSTLYTALRPPDGLETLQLVAFAGLHGLAAGLAAVGLYSVVARPILDAARPAK